MLEAANHRLPAAVVFDCDGVLIESVELKTEAFKELFARHPEHHEAIAMHHQENLGISRFDKFSWIYRELLGVELEQDESIELGRRFADLVLERAHACPAVAGAEDSLRQLDAAAVSLFVASGTPEPELVELIQRRGWSEYFQGIHGSPRKKPEILSTTAASLSIAPERMAFVGDGRSDFEAAHEIGVGFVLRETEAQAHHFREFSGLRVVDLTGLPERLYEAFNPVGIEG